MRQRKSRQFFGQDIASFRGIVWQYWKEHRRDLPWRNTTDPYCILVSEVMLQQTQVSRVLTKYPEFIGRFPDLKSLYGTPLVEVIAAWSGMGYNRRAIALKNISREVAHHHNGMLPSDFETLMQLPGVGRSTAGGVMAFAFNKPFAFIETNIRRAFIHHFFSDAANVHDTDLMPLIEQALDKENPREWYYALMDYGSMLPKTVTNPNRRSGHYHRQSSFEGSDRQLRGAILKTLISTGATTERRLPMLLGKPAARIGRILERLETEGFVSRDKGTVVIVGNSSI